MSLAKAVHDKHVHVTEFFNNLMERTETSTMIGLHSTQKESGTKVYTCLCYSLWYVNSSHAFFKERGCPTQNLF